jgi:hypothetical protein
LKAYRHLQGYLHRWKLFSIGKLDVRIHEILDNDRTPFLHSHPFHYISIILKGGYTEQALQPDGRIKEKTNRRGTILLRAANTFHRIKSLEGSKCVTLFFAFKSPGWDLKRHPEIECEGYLDYPDGLYLNNGLHQKRHDGKWFIPNQEKTVAEQEQRFSIHQNIKIEV